LPFEPNLPSATSSPPRWPPVYPPPLRVHDLRHTCASLLIRDGVSIKAVQHHRGQKGSLWLTDVIDGW
jgi:integrase